MIGNYVKVASRNLRKRKFFTFVNALGLSIGIALAALVFLFMLDESKFDQFHTKADRLMRIHENMLGMRNPGDPVTYTQSASLHVPSTGLVMASLPEVERFSFFAAAGEVLLKRDEVAHRHKVAYVSREFLEMFDFGVLSGDSTKALSDPSMVVLTESAARKFFGPGDAVGKTLSLDLQGWHEAAVTAVVSDVPPWSSLAFEVLVPLESMPFYDQPGYAWAAVFAELKPGTDPERFRQNLNAAWQRQLDDQHQSQRQRLQLPDSVRVSYADFLPLGAIHTAHEIPWAKVVHPRNYWVLSGIALLVLLVACVNYVALTLTSVAGRSKEVGLRKALGGSRFQIVSQFATESQLVALLALVLSMAFLVLFLRPFNGFVGKAIALDGEAVLFLAGFMIILTMAIGAVSGSYPAIFLAKQAAVASIQGGWKAMKLNFSRYLAVLQFGAASFLLICVLVMARQMDFVAQKDLGFDKENVIVVQAQQAWGPAADQFLERFRAALKQNPSVVEVAGTAGSIPDGVSRTWVNDGDEARVLSVKRIDPRYIEVMGIDLVAGRNFREASPADSNAVIVNEALVALMGWSDPLQEHLPWRGGAQSPSPVIGVVRDHHIKSLETRIEPLFMHLRGHTSTILVRVRPHSLPGVLSYMEEVWKRLEPDKPFDYAFLDEQIDALYAPYMQWIAVIRFAAFFAVVIACLGLFGLAGVNAANRTKEVGIRKVMGAGMADILLLLNRPFVAMAAIAFILAVPGAWYVMNQWLSNFEYSVAMDWWIFATAFAASLLLALATVSFHAWRAANLNPVETLKYE